MLKSIIMYLVAFVAIGIFSFTFHNNYIIENNIELPFNLKNIYLFFFVTSLVICVKFKVGSFFNKIQEQLGFIYLATFGVKIILFIALFYKSVIQSELNFFDRVTLLIPMVITLILEVFFVAKILNKNNT